MMKDLTKLSESELLELFQVEELETRLEMWGNGGDGNCNGSCGNNGTCTPGGGPTNTACGTNSTCGGDGGDTEIPIDVEL